MSKNNNSGKNNRTRFIIGILLILFVIVKAWISDNNTNNSVTTNAVSEISESNSTTASEIINNDTTNNDTAAIDEVITPADDKENQVSPSYVFRNQKLKDQHFDKHGVEMGFANADDYEKAASAVVNNPSALHKTEAEDGDDVYYIEATNEFVIVSTDGYLRTYFNPDSGIKYYNKQ